MSGDLLLVIFTCFAEYVVGGCPLRVNGKLNDKTLIWETVCFVLIHYTGCYFHPIFRSDFLSPLAIVSNNNFTTI